MQLKCGNNHCMYWENDGCTEEEVNLDERGICFTCHEVDLSKLFEKDELAEIRICRQKDVGKIYENLEKILDKLSYYHRRHSLGLSDEEFMEKAGECLKDNSEGGDMPI